MSARQTKSFFKDSKTVFLDSTMLVDGDNVHFIQTGNNRNPTLFFIHGSPGSWDAYKAFLKDSLLLCKFRLIAIDRPGFGYSDFGNARNLFEQAHIIEKFVRRFKNDKSIFLVGHSYGGPLVVQMAVDNPYDYDGIVVLSGALDPLAEKYPSISPYVYCADNPIIYVDPDGRELVLTGDKANTNQTMKTINGGIGGGNIARIDKSGNVTLRNLNDKQMSKLTSEQKAFYGTIKDAVDAKGKVSIGVVSKSEDVLIGSYVLEKIDIADINAFGDGKAVDQYSTLGHEIKEQQEKQLNGEGYKDAHKDGMNAESSITGYERQSAMATTTSVTQSKDGKLSGNADVIYTKGTEKVKASINITNNNVTKVERTNGN